ncbi:rhomboid family intramembrane serine protease [Aliikangiella sp. IMCC44359]|uniref:rhomboid family intramembrane serine protease n=1 Tax=Aliikangiella sp. IMCC44359 TaxID=3459125 RepID=UPI00403AADB5
MNRHVTKNYQFVLFLVAVMWLLEFANIVVSHELNAYALSPRQYEKLPGVITMHFLHWNLTHLISNSVPLLIMGFFVSALGKTKEVTITIMLVSGILVWIFARNGIHAGASGLVMGYWGYLISSTFFERNIRNILIAIITIFLYGGIVFSLLDFRETTSFEGHLFGFSAGLLSAWLWRKRIK